MCRPKRIVDAFFDDKDEKKMEAREFKSSRNRSFPSRYD
jgi:hypothetical protein